MGLIRAPYSPNTSTLKEHLSVNPALSLTVYCTVCVPIKNFFPDLWLLVTVTSASGSMPMELSLYVGSTHVITAWSWWRLLLVLMSSGHVILGGSLSVTEEPNKEVNIKVQEIPGKCFPFSNLARTLSEHVALRQNQCNIRRILGLSLLLLVEGKSLSGSKIRQTWKI